MEVERKQASNWYRWLWLSPLVTLPTLVCVLFFVDPGYMFLCEGRGICDWRLAQKVSLAAGVLLSSLWHLVLLKPVFDKRPFVHWHGMQAMCLAGLRTAVPLLFVIAYGDDVILYAIPMLIIIWFLGTIIGQQQADQGTCSLAKLAGYGEELACYQKPERTPGLNLQNLKTLKSGSGDPDQWLTVIRFSQDPDLRRQALVALKALDMVEDF